MSAFTRPGASLLSLNMQRCRIRRFSAAAALRTAPRRTRDLSSSFSNTYDPDEKGRGPMFDKSTFGVPKFYPRDLKRRVDEYVVGQERAKKSISSILFNHYQGQRRRQYHDEQERKRKETLARRHEAGERLGREPHSEANEGALYRAANKDTAYNENATDPAFDEPAGHTSQRLFDEIESEVEHYVPEDTRTPTVKIDKSNMLLIGPTGVGKTYILETLSKKIDVPITICDCNSFTQAGYVGQDVETCIERLLVEADYDIKAAEHGIVVLDELDKIAKRETATGRDVSGEGVQQALLKLIEGTKVTVAVKDTRSSRSANPITTNFSGPGSSSSTSGPQASTPPAGKCEQYTIDTTNILFVMCGAFVGLDKVVLNRVSKPGMGFGSELRSRGTDSKKPDLPPELFKFLPHQPAAADTSSLSPLDLANTQDLQAFGMIPELIGRLHNIVALAPLSQDDLMRILTEPRNSLVAQYTALFETYPSSLRFTRKALAAVAERAEKSKTGARGLKMEMERVLAEAMFDAPMPYVLVTEKAVRGQDKVAYWGKDGRLDMERTAREEDGVVEELGGREVVGSAFGTYKAAEGGA